MKIHLSIIFFLFACCMTPTYGMQTLASWYQILMSTKKQAICGTLNNTLQKPQDFVPKIGQLSAPEEQNACNKFMQRYPYGKNPVGFDPHPQNGVLAHSYAKDNGSNFQPTITLTDISIGEEKVIKTLEASTLPRPNLLYNHDGSLLGFLYQKEQPSFLWTAASLRLYKQENEQLNTAPLRNIFYFLWHPKYNTLAVNHAFGIQKGAIKTYKVHTDTLEVTPSGIDKDLDHYGTVLSWCLYNNSLASRTYDPDQTLVTWDLETGKESFRWQRPEGKKDYIGSYVFNNDGIGAVAADKDHITLIDLRTGKKFGQFPIPSYGVVSGEWSEHYVPVYSHYAKKAFIFDIRNQQQALITLEHASEPHSTLISRNGSMVASLGEVNELITAYIKNGEQPATQETDNTANNYMLAWTANDAKCAVGNNETVNLYTPEITSH